MENLSSWLITFFIIMFWGFRVMVAMMAGPVNEFPIQPIDLTAEIVLLFIVLALVPFIFKRKIWATIIYLALYGWYFGRGLFTDAMSMINGETLSQTAYLNMLVSFIGVILPLSSLMDMLFTKIRRKPEDKNTDWYYNNEAYDRKLDERADKNNYRTL